VSEKIKKKHAHRFRSALNATGLYTALDYFGSLSLSGQSKQGLFSSFKCVGGLVNEILTMAQKELSTLYKVCETPWMCLIMKWEPYWMGIKPQQPHYAIVCPLVRDP
jgi:hypothetical protein